MTIELVEVKVDTDINRKTVVVFDPEYASGWERKTLHTQILDELFPDGTLFCGLRNFTLTSLREGNVAVGLRAAELVSLNPAVFIINPELIAAIGTSAPVTLLLKNLQNEKRLCGVKRVVITDFQISKRLSRQLASFGIKEDQVYSWHALSSAREFRAMAKGLV